MIHRALWRFAIIYITAENGEQMCNEGTQTLKEDFYSKSEYSLSGSTMVVDIAYIADTFFWLYEGCNYVKVHHALYFG